MKSEPTINEQAGQALTAWLNKFHLFPSELAKPLANVLNIYSANQLIHGDCLTDSERLAAGQNVYLLGDLVSMLLKQGDSEYLEMVAANRFEREKSHNLKRVLDACMDKSKKEPQPAAV